VRTSILLGLFVLGCASAPPPAPAAPPPIVEPPPIVGPPAEDFPRSSIAAILAHRQELALTSDQLDVLGQRDDALAKEDAPLRARLAAGTSSSTLQSSPTPSAGMGGGRHGGGHHGGQHPQQSTGHAPDPLTQIDDNDTRAYLEIEEKVLTEAQRPRAREIASAYREALYDRQHPSASRGGQDAGSLAR
jgi:hypothetical protein